MNKNSVPFVDLQAQNSQVAEIILESWKEILASAGFVGGKFVKEFENLFAKTCNVSQCVTVSSGTDALHAALFALDVSPGDEVILPANTFIATAEAVQNLGGVPVLADCENGTWNIDPHKVKDVLTPKTVGIIGVHLYGNPCNINALRKISDRNNLWLLEDAAQAYMATLNESQCGSLADIAAFSFYPGKNLGATGEGGAVTTDNEKLANKVRMYVNHGSNKKYYHETRGTNARMPALIAASLCAKMNKISEWTENRRMAATYYLENIANDNILLPHNSQSASPAWHLFVVHCKNRDQLATYLNNHGVSTGMHYPIPIHLQPQFAEYGYRPGDFPCAEFNASHCLSLPMFETITHEQLQYVVDLLNRFEA